MNSALILIDIQNDYFKGGKCELDHPTIAAKNAKSILIFFRKNKLPIFHVKHINKSNNATFFLQESDGIKINSNVCPIKDEKIFVKHVPNSFFHTRLTEAISKGNINHIVVCGMMTHMCIDTTVRCAKNLGLLVTLIEDGCTTKDLTWRGKTIPSKVVHETYMASLNGMFAKVISTKEFLQNPNINS